MKPITAEFPQSRLRRNRREAWCRDLVAETHLSVKDLVYPLFVREEKAQREISAMPGVFRHSLDELISVCQKAQDLGIRAVMLFPYIEDALKCETGKEACNPNNLICRAVRLLKSTFPHMGVMVDVALDLYTTHGHDGVLRRGHVANDESIEALKQMSLVLAHAGVDVIAPSDMMDGRIGAIRAALDQESSQSVLLRGKHIANDETVEAFKQASYGHVETPLDVAVSSPITRKEASRTALGEDSFQHVRILAYSAKYASAFYGPFREALGSLSALGKADKKTYQMDPANAQEALREGAQDVLEGADMLLVKPGLPYLDILYRFKETFLLPLFVYQVSGEYSMLKAAAEKGWIDYEKALMESLLAFKRAGASGILTYGALEAAEILKRSL